MYSVYSGNLIDFNMKNTASPASYLAFISCSEKDEQLAEELFKFLVKLHIPKILRDMCRDKYALLHKPSSYFFYRKDLGAKGNIDDELETQLQQSLCLISICSEHTLSPEGQESYVEKGIRLFTEQHPEDYPERWVPVIHPHKDATQRKVRAEEYMPTKVRNVLGQDLGKKSKQEVFTRVAEKILGLPADSLWNWWERKTKRNRIIKRVLLITTTLALVGAGVWSWDYNRVKERYYADYVMLHNIPHGIKQLSQAEVQARPISYRFLYQHYRVQEVRCWGAYGKAVPFIPYPWCEIRPDGIKVIYNSRGDASKLVHLNEYGSEVMDAIIKPDGLAFQQPGRLGVAYINAKNDPLLLDPTPRSNTPNAISSYKIEYDAQGREAKVFYLSVTGMNVHDAQGIYGIQYTYDENTQKPSALFFIDKEGKRVNNKDGIGGMLFEHNEKGETVRYVNADGASVRGPNGVPIVRYLRDSCSRMVAIEHYDSHEKLCPDQAGVSRYRLSLDEKGNLVEYACYNQDNQPILNNEGWHLSKKQYDEQGVLVRNAYYDTSGNPINGPKGWSYVVAETKGNSYTETSYDRNDQPVPNSPGGCVRVRTISDEKGRRVEQHYLNERNEFTPTQDGEARVVFEYDDVHEDKVKSRSSFSDLSTPCMNSKGYHKIKSTYDAIGNRISIAYQNTKLEPVIASFGCAFMYTKYDALNRMIESNCKDDHGNPIMVEVSDGKFATMRVSYDEYNELNSVIHLDDKGLPCTNEAGVSQTEYERDAAGNTTRVRRMKVTYAPPTKGWHDYRRSYDEHGNVTHLAAFNIDGSPAELIAKSGLHAQDLAYNESGQKVLERDYDLNRNIMKEQKITYQDDGIAMTEITSYTTINGKNVKNITCYFKGKKRATIGTEGTHIITYQYDSNGKLKTINKHDTNKNLIRQESVQP